MKFSSRATRPAAGYWPLAIAASLLASACSGTHLSAPTGSTSSAVSPATSTVSESATLGVGPLVSVTDPAPAVPAFPPVVSLHWLDGPSQAAAIRVPGTDVVRWQGPTPGAAAQLLAGGAYRWVGPDGSMVGCAPRPKAGRSSCVGIDPAGNTAITGGGSAVRVVYGPDGGWLGDFEVNGTRVAGGRPTGTLDRAIAATGVDMAGLVDFVTAQPPFAGGITGDPHFITTGGIRVTSQQLGDFDARAGDPVHEVQIRTEAMPYRTDVAEVTAAVVGASGHRVEFRIGGGLFIDGIQITSDRKFRQITVPGGLVVGWWPPDPDSIVDAVVLWPDGAAVAMAADPALGLTIVGHLPTAAVGGLFGTGGTGRQSPPGTVPTPAAGPDSPATATHGDFAGRKFPEIALTTEATVQSWRVAAGQSMFVDPEPAPVQQAAAPSIAADASIGAQKYCATADLSNKADLASCVFDVARTGDAGYVAQHAELAASAEKLPFPSAVAARWSALVLGSVAAPVGLGLDAQVDAQIPAGDRRVYLIDVPSATALDIRATPCSGGRDGDEPASDGAALRLFDRSGHPVSARRSNCGRGQTDVLAAGSYYLVLAGAQAGPATPFRLRVTSN